MLNHVGINIEELDILKILDNWCNLKKQMK